MRSCDECEIPMMQGYVIDGGIYYYCSDKCLHSNFSPQRYAELHGDGEGETYWTEWDHMNCDHCDKEATEGYSTSDSFYCNSVCLLNSGSSPETIDTAIYEEFLTT